MNANVEELQNVRRVLGYAALGVMIAPEVAKTAEAAVQEADEKAEIGSAAKAVGALVRGLLPSATLCREGQRDVIRAIEQIRERSEHADIPRSR